MVLELLGEPCRPPGLLAWRFSGATGGPLNPAATLDGLRVVDGELLRLGPHTPPPSAPVFDDPVDALAATADLGGVAEPWLRGATAVAASVLAAGALALAPRSATTALPAVLVVLLAATGAAFCLARAATVGAAVLGPRPAATVAVGPVGDAGRDGVEAACPISAAALRRSAVTAVVCAVAFAAAGGWAGVSGPSGAGQLLVAAAAAGTTAAVGQVLVRVVAPVLLALAVVAATLVGLALLRLWLDVPATALAAGAGALALAAGPLLPRVALGMAGLPRPSIPADADELVRVGAHDGLDRLSPAEFADRADLARGVLAGLVAGTAAVAATAAVPVAASGGWMGPALASVLVVLTGLRSRGFADRASTHATLLAALAGSLAVAGILAAQGGPTTRLAVAGAAGVWAVALAGWREGPVVSPLSRWGVDLLEGVLLAAAIPLALGVMGAYALVRGM